MPTRETRNQQKTYLPSESTKDQFEDIIRFLKKDFPTKHATLQSSEGETVELPETLFDVLRQVSEALISGQGVSVIPMESQLTTQQAADYLGISRPTLVKLLESDEIPFTKVGRHRRVLLGDLVSYMQEFRIQRRTRLKQMARAGQEAGVLELTAADMTDLPEEESTEK